MFRLINAEGDFLPGLIADYYAGKIVLQFHSIGMYLLKNMIINAIVKNLPNVEVIYSKSSNTLPHKANIVAKDEILYTKNDLTISTTNDNEYWKAKEKGLTYFIDYLNGQKTGFFLDQQYNRSLVRELSKDRMVLNCFCYTGGFSIAALAGKAKQVDSIDISKRALMVCEKNATENGFNSSHSTKCEDVVTYIDKIEKDYYDLIILDPPAFAKHNKDLHNALRGYRTINQKAMEKIKSGGLLFTFSCSQVVSKEDFLTMLFSCAVLSNRKVRIVKRLFQNTDHPQSIFHPEGDYLKGFLLYVE
jgi:23S rRNA (cytosine1962-C5)-methyltransferase